MKKYEYEITMHSAETFKQVTWYCSKDGACNLEEVPVDQVRHVTGLLNERGARGWSLIQVIFNQDGFLAFWKRRLNAE